MESVLLFLSGGLAVALAHGAGYLIKRRLTQEKSTEQVNLYGLIVNLMARMKDAGVSIGDVRDFEAALLSKARIAETQAETPLPQSEPVTQSDMNAQAAADLQLAEAQMAMEIAKLRPLLGSEELALLMEAQEKWEAFQKAQAQFASAQFEGGSMQPMIYGAEAAFLANDRAKAIRAHAEERRAYL